MRKNEKITALYERLSRDDFGKDDDQQRESNSISNHGLQRQERTADRLDRIHRTHGVFRDNDAQIVVTIIGWRTISTGAKEINRLGFDSFRDNPTHRLQFCLQGFRLC